MGSLEKHQSCKGKDKKHVLKRTWGVRSIEKKNEGYYSNKTWVFQC